MLNVLIRRGTILVAAMLFAAPVVADTYMHTTIADLTITEGALPEVPADGLGWRPDLMSAMDAMMPYAILDGPGEVVVQPAPRDWGWAVEAIDPRPLVIAFRLPEDRDVTGRLVVPNADSTGMVALRFRVDGDERHADSEVEFLTHQLAHLRALVDQGMPGTAWFRHEARRVEAALREIDPARADALLVQAQNRRPGGTSDIERTYALVTGGLAVAENLQLDRELAAATKGTRDVDVATVAGITVREYDWSTLTKDLHPAADPLASAIPADQHAVFFPTFEALLAAIEYVGPNGGPLAQMVDSRAEAADLVQRYERQLALPINGLTRQLGPRVVRSVALTGGDPYFRTGTDVAILFEAVDGAALRALLIGQRTTVAAMMGDDVRPDDGTIGGVAYTGLRTPDRTLSTYLAALDDTTVIVTNSTRQIERLGAVRSGAAPRLADLDEYRFFRDRYALDANPDAAFVLISDATIRRWCGPAWRIGTSRRTLAAATLLEEQARHLDAIVRGTATDAPIDTDLPMPGDDTLTLTPRGVRSATYGTLAFLTPVGELDVSRVTEREVVAYTDWRAGYERNWRQSFDPIGGLFSVDPAGPFVDLTIMPLIAGTAYEQYRRFAAGVALDPDAGDPHAGALLHGIFAINKDGEGMRELARMAAGFVPGQDPFGWLGTSVSLFVDHDPVWAELEDRTRAEQRFERRPSDFPIGAVIDVQSPLRLTAFLGAAKGTIEQFAPGMTSWSNAEHRGTTYVRIEPSEAARRDLGDTEDFVVCYAIVGGNLVVSLNEPTLRRAIDRAADRADGAAAPNDTPWLGESLGLRADRRVVPLLDLLFRESYQRATQVASWRNRPILDAWRARYPDLDPLAVHMMYTHRRPVCPGGGVYRWNESFGTMESTTCGHPGEPRMPDGMPALLGAIESINAGLTFERDGLRARVELTNVHE
ncbi:MAG: hypothetical protein KDA25_00550 [Phycisphaerales bacterium]|nr:hypothetical protein [Phycisphaerales bacterium]